eukprot:scaffold586586_cov114-Attheya_sp.AAC.1
MFALLQQFIEERGHTRVPCNYSVEGLQLGQWVTSQQKLHRRTKIRDDRRRQLKSVGFLWARDERLVWTHKERSLGMGDVAWTKMYNHLVDFHWEHKHCMISTRMEVKMDDGSSKNLGTWVIRQRRALRDGILKEDRKQLLNDLGFVWEIDHYDVDTSLRARQWQEMYTKFRAFKETHGHHCQIPVNYKDDPALGKWARNQRASERTGRLDETRFERLDALCFEWDPCGSHWNKMHAKLRAYYDKHGHCQIPISYPEDPVLGKWVRKQRILKTHGTLNDDRFERLNALEFVWSPN